MRVTILEHPRLPSYERFNDIANTPLWSCLMAGYACAALRNSGIEADILDARFMEFAAAEKVLLNKNCDLLAVQAVYFWENTPALFDFLKRLRENRSQLPIVLFGFFPTLVWDDILKDHPVIDGIVVGEPEFTLAEAACAWRKNKPPKVPGLAITEAGRPILHQRRPPINELDSLAIPLRPNLIKEKTVSILGSRGCYNGCNFCLIPALNNGRKAWRGRSASNIVSEIRLLRDKGKRDFYFVDPNFIGPGQMGRKRCLELSHALADLDITFGLETRAADVAPGLVKALVEAGLTSLLVGLESGSLNALKRMGKNSSPHQNLKAVDIIRDCGLEPEIGFIMFEPQNDLDDVKRNFDFLKQAGLLNRLGRTANLLYHHQIALKGTRLYREALLEKRMTPSGLFGFEGLMHYKDSRVAWLAEAVRGLCLTVLRNMGRPESGIYWAKDAACDELNKRSAAQTCRQINDFLVDCFKQLLVFAQSKKSGLDVCSGEGLLGRFQSDLKDMIQNEYVN